MGTGSFPVVTYGRGVLLTTHPLLVPRSRKSRAIPLPTLWVTPRPVTGTLYFCSMPFLDSMKGWQLFSDGALSAARKFTTVCPGAY